MKISSLIIPIGYAGMIVGQYLDSNMLSAVCGSAAIVATLRVTGILKPSAQEQTAEQIRDQYDEIVELYQEASVWSIYSINATLTDLGTWDWDIDDERLLAEHVILRDHLEHDLMYEDLRQMAVPVNEQAWDQATVTGDEDQMLILYPEDRPALILYREL
jgi:hypothetical protein